MYFSVLVAEDFFEKGTLPFTVLSFPEKKYLRALKRSQQLDKSGGETDLGHR